MDHLDHFLSSAGFMPHGHCYLWKPTLVWTMVISDSLIGLAYIGIAYLLYRLVHMIELPFSGMFLAFGAFIAFCGATHFMEVWTLWNPDYWTAAAIKAATAVASVATGILLIPVKPKVIAMAHAARLSEERKDKLEIAHKELGILYERIRHSDELKTNFFANISHELRTPLTLIIGPVEELLKKNLDPQTEGKLDLVNRNAKSLLRLVNDLLDISKLEAGRMTPEYSRVDLAHLIRLTVAHFETVMQKKNIFLSLDIPEELIVEVDSEKIQRVMMNLLSNAVKFVPAGGRVKVYLSKTDSTAVIKVADSGPGIDPVLRAHIFERFRQGDPKISRKSEGTGLGLAIVKEFVELHMGTVELQSNELPGAAFVIKLPIYAPKDASVSESPTFIEDALPHISRTPYDEGLSGDFVYSTPQSSEHKVLVCEDNPDMRKHIAEALSSRYKVYTSVDGRDGITKAKLLKPDLIISDIMMPNMGGDELLLELKKDSEIATTPVLLLSARADEKLRLQLLKSGANDFVVKPFSLEELEARASNLIEMSLAKQILSRELLTKSSDLVELAREISLQKNQAQMAKESADIARNIAEQASYAKSAFLSLVSHELKTPLTSIFLTLQILKEKGENLNDKQHEMLERALRSSNNLTDLLESLLQYVRVDSTNKIQIREPMNLVEQSRSLIEELTPLIQEKKLNLTLNTQGEERVVSSDPKLFRVILSNLVSNSIKYTKEGSIIVTIEFLKDFYCIRVKDTGVGIPESEQTRIFDPFVQLEPLARKGTDGGVGLGLALVNQIVKDLGGRIELKSEVNVGSELAVYLPS